MMWVIAILIIILTLSILKDTHVEVYYRYHSPAKLQEEYDVMVPLWNVVTKGLLKVKNLLCKRV